MTALTALLSSLALSIVFALMVVLALRRPLADLLVELCGTERRARFWAAFTALTLVLTAFYGTLTTLPGPTAALWEGAESVRTLLVGVRASTLALLLTCVATAFTLLLGI
jgi:hypothetical protein